MARVFKRGELKEVITAILADLGESHGYGIMSELQARVGDGWKPSPGAVYPALLALVDKGYVDSESVNGTQVYRITQAGRNAVSHHDLQKWRSLSHRAATAQERVSVGKVLDRSAAQAPHRRRLVDPAQQEAIEAVLADAFTSIGHLLKEGQDNG